ncbi:MAG: hypothetical protein M1833_003560 [Piccolia ochrophora]|nr:MAG: hypothetical protein M1833_003560 [Piccolia ochrophora]
MPTPTPTPEFPHPEAATSGPDDRHMSWPETRIATHPDHADFPDWLSTFDQLTYESDVDGSIGRHPRLVDQRQLFRQAQLWVSLLRFRRRIHGFDGISAVWRGALQRKIILPTNGPEADFLWGQFIELGFRDEKVLTELYEYATMLAHSRGMIWAHLCESIVSYFFERGKPMIAERWHRDLAPICQPAAGYLTRLAPKALATRQSQEAFRRLYESTTTRNLYDIIIPLLCSREDFPGALRWHSILMKFGDHPSDTSVLEPLRKYLARFGDRDQKQLEAVTDDLIQAGVPFEALLTKAPKVTPIMSREFMNRILGDVHSIAPKSLDDGFCARILATRAISVDLLIRGMGILGVEAIGPIALRELALRKCEGKAILQRISQLRDVGISIGSSHFSKLVRALALDGREDVLKALVESDQHPDTVADASLQEKLLVHYIQTRDWLQTRKTLAILTRFARSPYNEYWNVCLRAYLSGNDLEAAKRVLESMRLAGTPPSVASIQSILSKALRKRKKGRRPSSFTADKDDLQHVISYLFAALRAGSSVSPWSWKELFRRLHVTNRREELERLAVWLTYYYNPNMSVATSARYNACRASPTQPAVFVGSAPIAKGVSTSHEKHPLQALFPIDFQRAILSTGFDATAHKRVTPPTSDDLSQCDKDGGIQRRVGFLRALRQRGVHVRENTLQKAFRMNRAPKLESGPIAQKRERGVVRLVIPRS